MSSDAIYWRRMRYGEPEVLYIRAENLHFWPGEGPCVDGFYYWLRKGDNLGNPSALIKRIPLSIWQSWGRKKHAPPEEKPNGVKKHPIDKRDRALKEQQNLPWKLLVTQISERG